MEKNLILTGFMGTGKTKIGKLLARELDWEFVDLDEYIVQSSNLSISDIFVQFGETHFRKLETEAIEKLKDIKNTILACGGGTVLLKYNVSLLQSMGRIINLTATPDEIKKRIEKSDRPLLKLKKIETILAERRKVYSQFKIRIDTTHKHPKDIVAEILAIAGM